MIEGYINVMKRAVKLFSFDLRLSVASYVMMHL